MCPVGASGINDDLLRLSVGLEHPDDLAETAARSAAVRSRQFEEPDADPLAFSAGHAHDHRVREPSVGGGVGPEHR